MKNIFLIGDSIRVGAPGSPGYGIYVKKKLEGRANVYAPTENCGLAQNTLRYLHEWAKPYEGQKIDIVHWNNGLWDLLRINGDGPITPLDMYLSLLERIYNRIRQLFPEAKVIFALTTTVAEEIADPNFTRYNSEINQYNEAAAKLMLRLGADIDDLYSVAKEFDMSMRVDWVHFSDEGSEILADHVIKSFGEI